MSKIEDKGQRSQKNRQPLEKDIKSHTFVTVGTYSSNTSKFNCRDHQYSAASDYQLQDHGQ